MQVRTALADTPGSRLGSDCEALLAQDRFVELLEKLLPHIDVLYSKASRTGVFYTSSRACHAIAHFEQTTGPVIGLLCDDIDWVRCSRCDGECAGRSELLWVQTNFVVVCMLRCLRCRCHLRA